MLKNVLLVGVSGMAGALARYGMSAVIDRWWTAPFPLATFLVNVLGSFGIGLVMALALERGAIGPDLRLALATGFLGAFTTFSALEYETNRLAGAGSWFLASIYVALSFLAGFAAVQIGAFVGRGQ
ncbi:MAG: fluoride efflux transporter CrcB [Acidobacteria bacterium]|nr:fluoride efflux transporter CrcB [Acidobacteriota bacterium]